MWVVSAATVAYCSKKVKENLDERKVPLMGVLGAFVFAAMMINFTIPGTGSSGHLGGGLLLAILLGPHAAFLVIASVLVVQALFFADGGLLALGCNIFNLGFFPAFIAYPLIYKNIVRGRITTARLTAGATLSAIVGLQLGPFTTFVTLMQPIHLAIGIVEGIATSSVVSFIWKASPQILDIHSSAVPLGKRSLHYITGFLLAAALITGGFVSWYASKNPDGLEWSVSKATNRIELNKPGSIHNLMSSIQNTLSVLPHYSFRTKGLDNDSRLGSSASGIIGGLFTLGLALLVGFTLKRTSIGNTLDLLSDSNTPPGTPEE
jgi:cobalt/nickel transport system permease protein